MIRFRVQSILREKGKSQYWLSQQLGGMCYRNLKNILDSNVSSIRISTLEKLCEVLDVSVGELFEEVDEQSTQNIDDQ